MIFYDTVNYIKSSGLKRWVGGCKSWVMGCLQQSTMQNKVEATFLKYNFFKIGKFSDLENNLIRNIFGQNFDILLLRVFMSRLVPD